MKKDILLENMKLQEEEVSDAKWLGFDDFKILFMSDDEILDLLASDGMLVKRPLVVGDDFVLTGFRENEWEGYICDKNNG